MQNYTYKVSKIKKVVDGDTVDFELDLGFSIKFEHRFRLLYFDAPETYRPKTTEEKEAGLRVKNYLISELELYKNELYVQSTKLGIYGRYEGEILAVKNGQVISINKNVLEFMKENKLTKEDLNVK